MKKFAMVLLVVVALCGVCTEQGWAIDRGIYDASNWTKYLGTSFTEKMGNWPGYSVWVADFGEPNECFMTASVIIHNLNDVYFNQHDKRKLVLEGGHVKGVGPNANKSVDELVTTVAQRFGPSNEEQVRAEFSKAQVGDLIQFNRSPWSSQYGQHTVIVSGFYDDGIEVLHGGWDQTKNSVENKKFSYAQFANWFGDSAAGFTIYRFGERVIPDDWIPIDEAHFPDEAFREYLLTREREGVDGGDNNGHFSPQEIEWITYLDGLDNKGITNLQGIKFFTNLKKLYINENRDLGTLDLSGMTKLEVLECRGDGLTTLNLSGCTALKSLNCENNALTTLSPGVYIKELNCSDNKLTELSVYAHYDLEVLNCSYNQLTSLNVGGKTSKLRTLDCSNNNKLTSLGLTNCTALEELFCQICGLTELDVSKCTVLKELNCHSNNLTELDLSNCKSLQKLVCPWNSLGTLDISSCYSLQEINCIDNRLPYVDIITRVSTAGLMSQKISGWRGSITADKSKYSIDFSAYIPSAKLGNVSNVKGYSSSGSEISTSFQNGVATFTSAPAKITYAYLAGYNSYGNRLGMTVTVSNLTFLLPRPSDYTILTDTPLPEGIVGRSYSATIQMWGYYADLKLDSNSSLPEGLSLSETSSTPGNRYLRTCQITGTPAKAGEYTFSTELWNAVGLASTRKDFKIKVVEKPTITTTSPLKEATVGAYYSMTFGATGTTPITWSKTSGTLPGGISFKASTKTLSGTPTKSGTFGFYIEAENEAGPTEKYFRLTVNPEPSITTTSLADATKGKYYSKTLSATGGTSPLTWSKTGGTATWATVSSSGVITGTPPAKGTYTLNVKVTDNNGASVTQSFSIVVTDVKPVIKTASLASGTVGMTYNTTLTATGTTPITWNVSGLPSGVTCSEAGVISGTPTTSGTFTITVTATNGAGSVGKQLTFTITEAETALTPTITVVSPTITTSALSSGKVGSVYSATLTATGTAPITWSASGLPSGVTCSEAGVINGTPKSSGTFSIAVTASNKAETVSKQLTLNIAAAETTPTSTVVPPTITTTVLPSGKVGTAYSATLRATGTSPITWSASGLPSGVTCSEAGVISGTPRVSGAFTITITASNEAMNIDKQLSLTIAAMETIPTSVVVSPAITTTTLPSGKVGTTYSATLTATGTTPITWSVSGLPKDMACNEVGVISGTPKSSGAFPISVTAKNNAGSDSKQLTLTIEAAGTTPSIAPTPDTPTTALTKPTITISTLPSGKVGTAYISIQLTATGTTPITWSASGLPKDMVCSEAGVISGTPKSSGAFPISVTAKNNAGSDSKQLTLTIEAAGTTPSINPTPDNPTPDNPTPVTPDREADNTDTGLQEKIFKQLEPPSAAKKAMERRGLGTPNTLQKSNSNVGAERNVSSLQDEEKKIVSDNNATVAAVLPEMSVNVSGTYLLAVGIDANVPTGSALGLHLFQRTTSGKVAVSLGAEKDKATFFNDEGTEITTVPENHHVNVAVDLTAGVTYAPVITAVEASSTPDNGNDKDNTPDNKNDRDNTPDNGDGKNGNNTSDSGGGGGGCNALSAGLALIALVPLCARKQK